MQIHSAVKRKPAAAIGEVLDMDRDMPFGAQLRATKVTYYILRKIGKILHVACDWCVANKRRPIRECVKCHGLFCAHASVYVENKGTMCKRCAPRD